ncbi:DNA sulfur modification protein DndD [Aurantimicrobium minutum]|uniref:AAA family ATPase n=1 Tax=Aurantimicrobium minutum TaxID=708131 RepID=UPI002476AF59|nr:AAA family ATPase [Aurantimicrobium minutum]MDH6532364.1 DNA sulfur modification protein DndD [Aurantimicrobium minutum]
MKIQKLDIHNFGILADVSFDFSEPSGNFAFVNGRNGRGKTSLLWALKWCLLGENPPKSFVSTWKIANSKVGSTFPVEVEMDLLLDDGESTASVRRSQLFEVIDSNTARPLGEVDLSVKSRDSSGFLTTPEVFPAVWLEKHFPVRLKNFFLFDGELMKNFFDVKVQTAVADSVREIAGVDLFESIANKLDGIHGTLNSKIAKLAGSKAQLAEEKYSRESKLLNLLVTERDVKEAELVQAKEEHRVIMDARKNSELTLDQAKRAQELLKLIEETQANRQIATEEFGKEALRRGLVALFHKSFNSVDEEYERAKAAGIQVPPKFEPSEVKTLLVSGTCICGTHFKEGSSEEKCLSQLISDSTTASQIGKILAETSREIESLRAAIPEGRALIQVRNDKIKQLAGEYERLKKEQNELSGVATNSELLAAGDLARKQNLLESSIDDLQRDLGGLKAQIERQSPAVERLYREFEKASVGEGGVRELQDEAAFSLELATAARKIHSIALAMVRERLENVMNDKISTIISKEFRTEITANFEVQTLDSNGLIAGLSEGQEMMKAYIFAIALREVMDLGFPLVVDTPFGRLDAYHREELSKSLVQLVEKEISVSNRQVIFLMHDEEYTPYTRKNFIEASPLETYLAWEVESKKSISGIGIDPVWYEIGAWKDYKAGKIK